MGMGSVMREGENCFYVVENPVRLGKRREKCVRADEWPVKWPNSPRIYHLSRAKGAGRREASWGAMKRFTSRFG
jgi:hypothetical protein